MRATSLMRSGVASDDPPNLRILTMEQRYNSRCGRGLDQCTTKDTSIVSFVVGFWAPGRLRLGDSPDGHTAARNPDQSRVRRSARDAARSRAASVAAARQHRAAEAGRSPADLQLQDPR